MGIIEGRLMVHLFGLVGAAPLLRLYKLVLDILGFSWPVVVFGRHHRLGVDRCLLLVEHAVLHAPLVQGSTLIQLLEVLLGLIRPLLGEHDRRLG
jgi:hypothetical protein